MPFTNPKIAILGWGRAGKDTAGGWFGLFTSLRYVGSCSKAICPLIAADMGVSVGDAWRTRHQQRMFWYNWANEHRKDDPARIAKDCLRNGDLVVGLRDKQELLACKKADLFDLTIWVHKDGVPPDPTVTFEKEDCDVIVENNGTYIQFYRKLAALCRFAGIMVADDACEFDRPTLDENGDWIGPLHHTPWIDMHAD